MKRKISSTKGCHPPQYRWLDAASSDRDNHRSRWNENDKVRMGWNDMKLKGGILIRDRRATNGDAVSSKEKQSKSRAKARKQVGPKSALFMLSPGAYVSPFDIAMAIDSGYEAIQSFGGVTLEDVHSLVQDAVFSRSPSDSARTTFFIGGKDINLALEMMAVAKRAMVPPFEVSLFADPGGSFTTAAAMVASVERILRRHYHRELATLRLSVFGATGVVGFASSVLAAAEGARVQVVAHDNIEPLLHLALVAKERFGVYIEPVAGQDEAAKGRIILESDIVFSAGPAGVEVITRKQIARSPNLLVAADVNAVAPAGIEGVEPFMDGVPLQGCSALGIGPLTIGNIKYKTQAELFRRMLVARRPVSLDFREAFEIARMLTTEMTPARPVKQRAKASRASDLAAKRSPRSKAPPAPSRRSARSARAAI